MTLNQVITRLQTICESHKQLHFFYYGNPWEWLHQNSGKVEWPAVLVEHNSSSISASGRLTTHNFRIYIMSLVNMSNDAESNETEVISDMMSIAEDLMALVRDPLYDDWQPADDAPMQVVSGQLQDYTAGVIMELPISTYFTIDRCQAPITE